MGERGFEAPHTHSRVRARGQDRQRNVLADKRFRVFGVNNNEQYFPPLVVVIAAQRILVGKFGKDIVAHALTVQHDRG